MFVPSQHQVIQRQFIATMACCFCMLVNIALLVVAIGLVACAVYVLSKH
jgi:hypothetical protein